MIITETERLILRRFVVADAQSMFALNGDPEVVRYTGDEPFVDIEAAHAFVVSYLRDVVEPEADLTRWSVVERASGEVLGFCGLRRQENGDVDLGFRLHRRCWGRGIATEAGRASLAVGFERFGLRRIVARARFENAGSLRVLEKLGLSRCGEVLEEGHRWAVYECTKP